MCHYHRFQTELNPSYVLGRQAGIPHSNTNPGNRMVGHQVAKGIRVWTSIQNALSHRVAARVVRTTGFLIEPQKLLLDPAQRIAPWPPLLGR